MRRVISLWFPRFQADRLTLPGSPGAAWRDTPFGAVTTVRGALRIACANAAARAQGIAPGLALTDARAVYPALRVAEADPAADAAALDGLADWTLHFTPWTAVEGLDSDGGAGLWLDITGCAHLFGGEEALLDRILADLARFGFGARAGLGDTKGAAWAAARFMETDRPFTLLPEGAGRQILPSLPVAALRLDPDTLETLRRLGLKRLSDLLALPRASLAARFGPALAHRLDQIFGHVREPFEPRRPLPPYRVRLGLPEPIGLTDDLIAGLDRLLDRLCDRLEQDGKGARRLALDAFRVDGSVQRVEIGTARPVRAPAHLRRLFREKLDGIDAGFGIEALVLSAPATDPLQDMQTDLSGSFKKGGEQTEKEDQFSLLMDRLSGRLGAAQVIRPVPYPSHRPEKAVQAAGPLDRPRHAWPLRPRPPHLLPRPERAEAGPAPLDTPPMTVRWRRHTLHLTRAEGPERIAAAWWHGPPLPAADAVRDYWRVEDTRGRRLWLFRDGADWFVHGVLP